MSTAQNIRENVKEKYGQAALRVSSGQGAACCSFTADDGGVDPITSNLYDLQQAGSIPEDAVLASLGCGNPTALAELKLGEVVLDLGSGGGIDVLLSAKRVGPTGKAFGLDMTDEMLALARDNQRKSGFENVEFLKGEIEHIPLPDNSVDVIISNCVINLSADKTRVLQEAFRVLKPGGRFAVSDIVVRGEMPDEVRKNVELWIGCVAGAMEEQEYKTKLTTAGFEQIDLEPTRIYRMEEAKAFLRSSGLDIESIGAAIDGKFASMFVRAQKPGASPVSEKTIMDVFDPAMCCSTGVCGPAPDPFLPRFAADLEWLSSQGIEVRRHNLSQEPAAFAENESVKAALTLEGTDCLPMILVNGAVVSKGKYPVRYTLARWAGINTVLPAQELPVVSNTGCC